MKAFVYLGFIGLLSILLLTSAKSVPKNNYVALTSEKSVLKEGIYFNPQQFYNKQCTFCHNETGKIAPSMGKIKAAYLKAFPKKENFVKKMTTFVISPTDENRLIKNNKGKYKVMPADMFYDVKKIQKVAEFIFDKVTVPKLSKSALSNLENQTKSGNKTIQVNIKLNKGADLCEIMNLHSVDFDFAKYTVNSAMKKQLKKLVAFLKINPTIKIEVRNHTDSRGSAKHNLDLSNKRANSIRNYIISHGIDPNRVKAKGYGESQLLNHCKDGVKCTEEQHKQNRRTEIILL